MEADPIGPHLGPFTDIAVKFEPAQHVLLTGAGFTKPFGGYLADEMWATIFNQPALLHFEGLRRILLNDLDFESVYDFVINSPDHDSSEKQAITTAVRTAYMQMHRNMLSLSRVRTARSAEACRAIVSRFAGKKKQIGFFFTLNQDLFIEKFYSNDRSWLEIPGIQSPKWFNGQLGQELYESDWTTLPNKNEVNNHKVNVISRSESIAYVKLHGSLGWRSEVDSDVMAIGTTKDKIVSEHPLLKWYFSLFKKTLSLPNRKLVIIGYGFGDEHINEVIANCVDQHGLKLFLINPSAPRHVNEILGSPNCHKGNVIWDGLAGYYQCSVEDLYEIQSFNLTETGLAFVHHVGLS